MVREAQGKGGSQAAKLLIQTIAARDEELLERLDADWDRVRPADSPAKTQPVFSSSPQDQLLFRFRQAAAFSAQLAADPEHFSRIVREP